MNSKADNKCEDRGDNILPSEKITISKYWSYNMGDDSNLEQNKQISKEPENR